MGINLYSGFLDPEFAREESAYRSNQSEADDAPEAREKIFKEKIASLPRPSIDWVARHVLHAIDIGGEDCVGLGGDLDGISSMPAGIEGIQDYPKIAQSLLDASLTKAQVEKVCYRNSKRVFCEVLPP